MRIFDYLEPAESLGEIIFGLIMVLSFTLGARLFAPEGSAHELLLAAIGCNLAWGVIDGVLYVMNAMFERGRRARIVDALKKTSTDAGALDVIRRVMEPPLASVTTDEGRGRLYRDILDYVRRTPMESAHIHRDDLLGAVAVFLLVFGTAIPAALPFLFVRGDPWIALRVSNLLLIGCLFFTGYFWARHTNVPPVRAGLGITLVGVTLVTVAIALGG